MGDSDRMNECNGDDRGDGIITTEEDERGQERTVAGPPEPRCNAAVQAELERFLVQVPGLAECDLEEVAKLRDDQLRFTDWATFYFSGLVNGAGLALGKKPEDVLMHVRRPDGTPVIERARGEKEDLLSDCRVAGVRDAFSKNYEEASDAGIGPSCQWMRRVDDALTAAAEAGIAVERLPGVVEDDVARMIASGELVDDVECVAAYRVGWVASLRAQLSFSRGPRTAPRRAAEPLHPRPEEHDDEDATSAPGRRFNVERGLV